MPNSSDPVFWRRGGDSWSRFRRGIAGKREGIRDGRTVVQEFLDEMPYPPGTDEARIGVYLRRLFAFSSPSGKKTTFKASWRSNRPMPS